MKNNKTLLIIFVSVLAYNMAWCKGNIQQEVKIKGLPKDLNKEKIIFLEYEQIPIEQNTPRKFAKMYKFRNEAAIEANRQLHEAVKNYPFEYVISKRSEYKELIDKGYRYVLENDMMEKYNKKVLFRSIY